MKIEYQYTKNRNFIFDHFDLGFYFLKNHRFVHPNKDLHVLQDNRDDNQLDANSGNDFCVQEQDNSFNCDDPEVYKWDMCHEQCASDRVLNYHTLLTNISIFDQNFDF